MMHKTTFGRGLLATALLALASMGVAGVPADVVVTSTVTGGDGYTPGSNLELTVAITANNTTDEPDGVAFVVQFDTDSLEFASADQAPVVDAWSVAASPSNDVVLGTVVKRRVSAYGVRIGMTPTVMVLNFTVVSPSPVVPYAVAVGPDTLSSAPVASLDISNFQVKSLVPSFDNSALTVLSVTDWTLQ